MLNINMEPENDSRIDKETTLKVMRIIMRYIDKLVNKNTENTTSAVANLFVLLELFEYTNDKTILEETIHKQLIQLKLQLDRRMGIGLFNGFGEIALMCELLEKKTNSYYKLNTTVHQHLYSITENYLKYCNSVVPKIYQSDYDVISGLSGVGYYLLDKPEAQSICKKILDYISRLLETKVYNGKVVPVWHIIPDNQFHIGHENYIDGHFNYGLSHGLAGPLAYLTKFNTFECGTDMSRDLLVKVVEIFKLAMIDIDDVIYWPGLLQYTDYIKENYSKETALQSTTWCYGNLSISKILYNASLILEDTLLEKTMLTNITNICEKTSDSFKFGCPIICHGYCGAILTLVCSRLQFSKWGKEDSYAKAIDFLVKMTLRYYDYNENAFVETSDKGGFLDGEQGIILALISAIKNRTSVGKHLLID